MKKAKKKVNNGLIVMSKGERAGVISLLSVISVLLAFSVFRPAIHFSKQDEKAFHNLDSMIALQERVARQRQEEERVKNEVTMAKTEKPAAKSSSKSKKTAATPTTTTKKTLASPTFERKDIPILDINVADSLSLVELPQIGEVMASRIQRYRDRLGGFVTFDQLYEVKGMDSARFATIKPYIILENNEIRKLDVNRDDFKTLLRHPYLDYDQVKAIVNHRERKGFIKNWEQLQGIVGEVNPLLKQYTSY